MNAEFKFSDYSAVFRVPVFARSAESLVEDTQEARRAKPDMSKELSVFDE